jgi:hypothetical protein
MSTTLYQEAVTADVRACRSPGASLVQECVELYEKVLDSAETCLDAHINLAFLCWQCTETGFGAALHLERNFVDRADERWRQLLDHATNTWGNWTEAAFWQAYFDFARLGAPPIDQFYLELIRAGRCGPVPYFYLYAYVEPSLYQHHAEALLRSCQELPTFKNTYVASVMCSNAIPPEFRVRR